jgi:hypothetical protein
VAMLGFHKISQAVNPLAKMFFYFGERFHSVFRGCLATRSPTPFRTLARLC